LRKEQREREREKKRERRREREREREGDREGERRRRGGRTLEERTKRHKIPEFFFYYFLLSFPNIPYPFFLLNFVI